MSKSLKNVFKEVFVSEARIDVLRLLILNECEWFWGRQIERLTGHQIHSVRRVLTSLHSIGLLRRTQDDNKLLYKIDEEHLLYPGLERCFRAFDNHDL